MVAFAEHHIQLALRQFLSPGDTVFDVGANKGWLTEPISRLVGSRGRVVCFEPSPRNLVELMDLTRSSLRNAEVISAAAYHTSGEVIEFYENAFSNADSLYVREPQSSVIKVNTLSLDDYAAFSGDVPSLIKMDIEGAEFDALRGAENLIASTRPIIILETKPDDPRPFSFLKARGYTAYNLVSYDELTCEEDISSGRHVEDHIYLPNDVGASIFKRDVQQGMNHDLSSEGRELEIEVPLASGMNCVKVWGGCDENPYDALIVRASVRGRIVVNASDQLKFIFNPHFPSVLYASEACVARFHFRRDHADFHLTRIETRHITMSEEEHRKHKILDVVAPFGLDA